VSGHRVSFWAQQASPLPRRFTVPDYREKLYAQVRVRVRVRVTVTVTVTVRVRVRVSPD